MRYIILLLLFGCFGDINRVLEAQGNLNEANGDLLETHNTLIIMHNDLLNCNVDYIDNSDKNVWKKCLKKIKIKD